MMLMTSSVELSAMALPRIAVGFRPGPLDPASSAHGPSGQRSSGFPQGRERRRDAAGRKNVHENEGQEAPPVEAYETAQVHYLALSGGGVIWPMACRISVSATTFLSE